MRKTTFFILGLFILSVHSLLAQKAQNSLSNWTLQVTGSYAFSYQYEELSYVPGCIDFCDIDQRIGYGNTLHVEVNHKINSRSSLNLGVGKSVLVVREQFINSRIMEEFVGKTLLRFTSLSLGHKYTPTRIKDFNFFIENRLFVDIPTNKFALQSALSYQFLSGFIYDWSHSIKLLASPYIKTALTDYNSMDETYFPFSLGLDIGLLINLQKSESLSTH